MEELYREDFREAGLSPPQAAWMHLCASYGDRPYHNIAHALDVRNRVFALKGAAATRIAAWYHDAVYDVSSHEPGLNETRSADLAGEVLGAGARTEFISEVRRLILMTATHEPEPDDRESQILCDADLATLASEPDEYVAYSQAIRREYSHLDDRNFWSGRLSILQELLRRPQIFFTAEMQALENRARTNLLVEVGWLRLRLGNT